eukprot:6410270-Prymnesium_polylepis.1
MTTSELGNCPSRQFASQAGQIFAWLTVGTPHSLPPTRPTPAGGEEKIANRFQIVVLREIEL